MFIMFSVQTAVSIAELTDDDVKSYQGNNLLRYSEPGDFYPLISECLNIWQVASITDRAVRGVDYDTVSACCFSLLYPDSYPARGM